jgi:MFS family permease
VGAASPELKAIAIFDICNDLAAWNGRCAMQEFEAPQLEDAATSPHSAPLPPAGSRHSALLVVFLVMVIDLLGFAIVLPLLPRYGREFLEPLFPGAEHAALRGGILGLLMASFSLMQFIFAPLWGRVSDRAGRRPFLLLGLVGSVVFYTLFGFVSEWGVAPGRQALGIILLFAARLGAGIAGATVSTAQAVIADCTPPDKRSRGMALIGMAFGIGFTFGPILGAGSDQFFPGQRALPGYLAAGFSAIALVIAIVLMPETLQPGSHPRERRWFNLQGFKLAMHTPTVGLLILLYFLSTFAFGNFETTLPFLTQDVLHYGEKNMFLVFAYVGLVLAVAQGGLYRPLAKRGMQETTFILVGVVFMMLGLAGVGTMAALTSQSESAPIRGVLAGFLAAATVAVTGFAFVTPSVQSLVSRRSDPAKQGEILGVNQSANAISRILGPMSGAGLYFLPPAHVVPYLFAICLLLVALFLVPRIRHA